MLWQSCCDHHAAKLLLSALGITDVTTKPLDKARTTTTEQVNIFCIWRR